MEGTKEFITIGKKEYAVVKNEISQALLCFYPENPRIYSALDIGNSSPDQQEIENILCDMDHVKQLKESIKANGGLIDPLIVQDEVFTVLEGNSRLAAYRLLNRTDPVKWAKVKCIILPADIDDGAIFTLLGQYHIVGRKDWAPYEQAGYLYRMIKRSEKQIESIAKELGLVESKAKEFVRVYTYMIKHDDNHSNKWSYYVELLKSRSINSAMKTVEGFEDKIINDIKSDKIKAAIDIRNILGAITKVKGKEAARVIRDISRGDYDIYEGFKILEDSGKTGDVYKYLNRFRNKINEKEFKKRIQNGDIGAIKYELKQINKKVEDFLRLLNEE